MEDKKKSKIIDVIQKLLALATSPNEHEAALAASKAQEFMLKHKIEEWELTGKVEHKAANVFQYNVPMGVNKWRPYHWCITLMTAVSATFTCKVLYRKDERMFIVMGSEVDAGVCRDVYVWLFRQIVRLAEEGAKASGNNKSMKYRFNFYKGCSMRVAHRLRHEYEGLLNRNPDAKALVVVDLQAVVNYMKQTFPHTGKGTDATGPSDWAAFADGQRAGDRVRLKKE